jgi:GAF domain-containing protein
MLTAGRQATLSRTGYPDSDRSKGEPQVGTMTAQPAGTIDQVEESRLAAVRRYDILDTPPEGAFDRVASLAALIFDAPIATVTIVDSDRVWFKATHGLHGVTQIGRDPGLCASVVMQDDVYIVRDALIDPRTCEHPLVLGELGLRFYAAAPVITPDGHRLGTVNVIGAEPRDVTPRQAGALEDLAALVGDELELRLAAIRAVRAERELRDAAERRREQAEQVAEQLAKAAAGNDGAEHGRCSMDGARGRSCSATAEVRIADSSGESAWVCTPHAEEALLTTSGVFMADVESRALSRFLGAH